MTPVGAPLPSSTISVKGRVVLATPSIPAGGLNMRFGKVCRKTGAWVAGVLKGSHPEGQEVAVKNSPVTGVVVMGRAGASQRAERLLGVRPEPEAVMLSAPRVAPV